MGREFRMTGNEEGWKTRKFLVATRKVFQVTNLSPEEKVPE
jgi:hypothetical protein